MPNNRRSSGHPQLPTAQTQVLDPVADLAGPEPPTDPELIRTELVRLLTGLRAGQAASIGFPAATDLNLQVLAPFLDLLLNNLGDPWVDGAYPQHTKRLEREAVDRIADLLRAPTCDRWGYVTSGASEGAEHALWLARTRHPDAVVYYSAARHHSIPHVLDRLRMPAVEIRTDPTGVIDYRDLATQIGRRRHQPTVIVANIGTAMTEAVDDIRQITSLLDNLAVTRRWIHADAALSGIPLALLDPDSRPGFDFADGADSIIVSGHKFLGSPIPYGVLVVRDQLRPYGHRASTYTGSPDTTLSNSRSGLAALICWYTLHRHGTAGLRERADQARETTEYACQRLQAIGIPAWRHPWAFTVNLPTPPAEILDKWTLATDGPASHLICMPGVTRQQIDALVRDFEALSVTVIGPARPPKQRRNRLSLPILG